MTQPLFAPWRIRYILDKSKQGKREGSSCFMCDSAQSPERDPDHLVVARLPSYFLILNRYPYAGGHLLLCPYEHVGQLTELPPKVLMDLGESLKQVQELLQSLMQPHGINMGINLGEAAGAGFADHLHFHIIPRWNGDTNFLPLLADIQVIPQALEELYVALKTQWNQRNVSKT
jgi:ATP adenylyltransferase